MKSDRLSHGQSMDPQERLDKLFAAYRDACPDIEGSPDFVPALWAKIEDARPSSWLLPLRVWAARLVTASVLTAILLFGSVRLWDSSQSLEALEENYINALTADARFHHEDDFWMAGNER